jgi:hypothetical protein
MNITPHDLLSAFFHVFNKVWPVLGIGLCVALFLVAALTFLALVDACRRGPGSGWGQAYEEEGFGSED